MLLLWCVCNVWRKETKPACLELLFFPVCKRPAALLLLFSFSFFLSQPCAVIACCQQRSRSLPALQRERSQKWQKWFWRVNESGRLLRPLDCEDWKCTALPSCQQLAKLYDYNRDHRLNGGRVAPVVFCKKLLWSVAQENHTLRALSASLSIAFEMCKCGNYLGAVVRVCHFFLASHSMSVSFLKWLFKKTPAFCSVAIIKTLPLCMPRCKI